MKPNAAHLAVATVVDICLPAYIFLSLGNSAPILVLVPPLANAAHVL